MAGCVEEKINEVRIPGLSERCADMMRASFPRTDIEIKIDRNQASTTDYGGLGTMVVDVVGVRPRIPASGGFLAREVAARCRFENGILVEFRWTQGPFR
jgi:hypothetical protein